MKNVLSHIKALLPKHYPELLLSFDEYVDTWGGLIEAAYGSIMADKELPPFFGLDGDGPVRFSVETALVLCHDAMRVWRQGRRAKEHLCTRLEEAVVEDVAARIMGGSEAQDGFLGLYCSRKPLFDQLMPDSGSNGDRELLELIATARYVVSRCSDRDEDSVVEGIQQLSTHLVFAHGLFKRLDRNSLPDGNTVFFSKPRFIVREEI